MLDLIMVIVVALVLIGVLFVIPWLVYRWLTDSQVRQKTMTEHDAQLALYGGRHERVSNRATSNHDGVLTR